MVRAMPVTRMTGRLLILVMHVAQVILTVGGIGILFTRSSYEPVSQNIFGSDAPLMDREWLDMLMSPLAVLPLAIFVAGFVYFRKKSPESRKLFIDMVYTMAMTGWIAILLSGLYAPVASA
ncbi:hypothetical protein [Marinobacter sp.]|uniref:hypothetical protein n=1 Tax=Marinobacter sp. TaxID=50741 RepID=UPI00384B9188